MTFSRTSSISTALEEENYTHSPPPPPLRFYGGLWGLQFTLTVPEVFAKEMTGAPHLAKLSPRSATANAGMAQVGKDLQT